jgi:putative oxidoreductase
LYWYKIVLQIKIQIKMAEESRSKVLNISLWVVQGLLAAMFGMAGVMKLTASAEQLVQGGMTFVQTYGMGMVRFIGVSEVLGALGLILPAATRIKPTLTPYAAVGIGVIMILASAYHVSEGQSFLFPFILLLMAAFVVWGRMTKATINPK